MKVYSGLDQLPKGRAAGGLLHGCMVLEGGAWRGLYTQGALDALMENGINMDCTIGVSAGAMSGLAYVAGQIGFSARLNLTYRNDQNYCGFGALQHDHGITGFSYAFDTLFHQGEGFDQAAFENPGRRFVAVATNLETGKPVYFEKGKCTDIFKAVQASATVPYISKPVEIDGDQYLDGGLSVRVPYEWALAEGYEKIVVIRTRDRAYRKKIAGPLAINKMYRKLPEAVYDLDEQNARYNISLNGLDQLEEAGRIFVLAPEKPITIRRFESDMDKLGELYWRGYHETKERLSDLQQYLSVKSY